MVRLYFCESTQQAPIAYITVQHLQRWGWAGVENGRWAGVESGRAGRRSGDSESVTSASLPAIRAGLTSPIYPNMISSRVAGIISRFSAASLRTEPAYIGSLRPVSRCCERSKKRKFLGWTTVDGTYSDSTGSYRSCLISTIVEGHLHVPFFQCGPCTALRAHLQHNLIMWAGHGRV